MTLKRLEEANETISKLRAEKPKPGEVFALMEAVKNLCYGGQRVTMEERASIRRSLRAFFPLEEVRKIEDDFYKNL